MVEMQVAERFLEFQGVVGVNMLGVALWSTESAKTHGGTVCRFCRVCESLNPLCEAILNNQAGLVVFPVSVLVVENFVVCCDGV